MKWILLLSCLMTGLYYELASAVVSILMLVWLLAKARQGTLKFYVNDAAVFACALPLFYAASCLWARDSGLAVWGIVKYFPVALFGVCLMQLDSEMRKNLLLHIPWMGSAMTVISYILQFVPAFSHVFSVNGRLGGFFQYPNTFACFLLIGLAVLVFCERSQKPHMQDLLCAAVLVFGILKAGSRTVFLLAVPLAAVSVLYHRKKEIFGLVAAAAGSGFAAACILGEISGTAGGVERLTQISANASTFLGRLLYWKDAAPVILGHPFGLGYLGYYVSQGSFQTGVYSVRWIHNDVLQLLLDVGWAPAVFGVIAIGKAVFSRHISVMAKAVILILTAHCMMDFDLEFVFMYFVLLLCLDWEDMKVHTLQIPFVGGFVLSTALAVFSLYIGVVSSLTYEGKDELAQAAYPWNTLSNIRLLAQAETIELDALADRILGQNSYIALAWDAKARAAYARGDFATVIACKKQAIAQARYSIEEYEDYFEMLKTGAELYEKAGDMESAEICRKEITGIQDMLDALAAETDPLAYRIRDVPNLVMPKEYWEYLEKQIY